MCRGWSPRSFSTSECLDEPIDGSEPNKHLVQTGKWAHYSKRMYVCECVCIIHAHASYLFVHLLFTSLFITICLYMHFMCRYMHMHIYNHIHIILYIILCIYIFIYIYIYRWLYVYTYIYIHTYIYIYIITYIHTYIYMYTQYIISVISWSSPHVSHLRRVSPPARHRHRGSGAKEVPGHAVPGAIWRYVKTTIIMGFNSDFMGFNSDFMGFNGI